MINGDDSHLLLMRGAYSGSRRGELVPKREWTNTPKVAFLKLSRLKDYSMSDRGLCPFCDRIVNSEH
jgi:hypothetical protein